MKRFLLFLLIATTSNLFAQPKSILLSGEISTLSDINTPFYMMRKPKPGISNQLLRKNLNLYSPKIPI